MSQRLFVSNSTNFQWHAKLTVLSLNPYTTRSLRTDGQVAQLVERGPEKAGVGGSIPSLATTNSSKSTIGNLNTETRGSRLLRAHRVCKLELRERLFSVSSSA